MLVFLSPSIFTLLGFIDDIDVISECVEIDGT
jgi:uncharacterized membrane protein YkvA (DUF1232 family)